MFIGVGAFKLSGIAPHQGYRPHQAYWLRQGRDLPYSFASEYLPSKVWPEVCDDLLISILPKSDDFIVAAAP
jgi:hypothetical protein